MAESATCFSPTAVFGLGERIGFYAISTLSALAPIKSSFSPSQYDDIKAGNQQVQPKRQISSVITAQGITGVAWIATATIQAIQKKLSLYDAFIIIAMLFLLSTSFFYYFWNPRPSIDYRLFFLLYMAWLGGFSFYVGWNARTFGSQPECNNTVKILWIPHVKAASFAWFHTFGIVVSSIYISVCVIHIFQRIFYRQAGRVYLRTHCCTVLIVNIILMVIIERTIKINKVHTDSIWSFGQTFSIIMTLKALSDTWKGTYPSFKAIWLRIRAPRNTISSRPPSYASHLSYDSLANVEK